MRISQVSSLSFLLLLAWSLPALSQEPTPSTPQAPITEAGPAGQATANLSSPPPASFNDVLDHIVQREHLFVAQMRHMRPMIETYLQDLKNDKDGRSSPVKDEYFLGRLDMSDGPEDTSFIGQPGFGHRMLNHLTGLYAMHFLPLGFAQMVVLDTDFQKKYYKFTFARREFLGEVRCIVIYVEPKEGSDTSRFIAPICIWDHTDNVSPFTAPSPPPPNTSSPLPT